MDSKQNMEYKMVSEFISKTGASPNDALICLKTWGWDMKRALIDYNDTCTVDFVEDEEDNSKDIVIINHNTPSSFHTQENNIKTTPVLTKQNSIDMTDCKKLYRGISRATDNVGIVSRARYEIAKDIYKSIRKNMENENTPKTTVPTSITTKIITTPTPIINNFQYSVDTPDSTFILPNIYNYPDDFRIFIEKDLIEMSTLNALEQAQRLNWWVDTNACRKLWPLATTGDGNCLLHAASLGMWGFHDRKLTLRTALYSVLSDGKFKDALRRRWRFQQTQLNKRAGFVYSENEWAKEWDDIIAMASPEPRKSMNQQQQQQQQQQNYNDNISKRKPTFLDRNSFSEVDMVDNHNMTSSSITTTTSATAIYESLEEIHILALAHVLRRTIIVISDTVLKDLHGEAMAPITFGGVYLPLEIEPKECNRGPLLLAYDMAHFSALVPMENGNDDYPPFLVPLIDYENILLPIQFCIDPGENFDWKSYNGSEENWALTEREHIALLKEYLDIVYVTTNRNSPEDEICEDLTDDYDFDKKFIESEIVIPTATDFMPYITEETNNNGNGNNKSKASRQLQNVAKQFGSIGKNMSRKLKKNIGSIAKLGGKNSQKKNSFTMNGISSSGISQSSQSSSYLCSRILCARLRLKRHDYQEEMIRNYIECAQNRFYEIEKGKEQKMTTTTTSSSLASEKSGSGGSIGTIVGTGTSPPSSLTSVIPLGTSTVMDIMPKDDNISNSNNRKLEALSINEPNDNNLQIGSPFNRSICINTGCNQIATSDTSYLCPECFEQQKKQENLQYYNSSPRYGTGNSKFYTQADIQSHDSIRKLPSLRKLNELDQTLYLSNSTFYNDVLPSYEEAERLNKESQQYINSTSQHQLSSSHSPPSSSSLVSFSPPITPNRIDFGNNGIDTVDHHHNLNHNLIITTNESSIPITKPCKTLGCPFYGNSSTNFLCSKCQKLTTSSNVTIVRNNQQELNDYHHKQNQHPHHHHHHHSTFQTNPLYTTPTSVALLKSESKITSDI